MTPRSSPAIVRAPRSPSTSPTLLGFWPAGASPATLADVLANPVPAGRALLPGEVEVLVAFVRGIDGIIQGF